jgi:hypothetical protein
MLIRVRGKTVEIGKETRRGAGINRAKALPALRAKLESATQRSPQGFDLLDLSRPELSPGRRNRAKDFPGALRGPARSLAIAKSRDRRAEEAPNRAISASGMENLKAARKVPNLGRNGPILEAQVLTREPRPANRPAAKNLRVRPLHRNPAANAMRSPSGQKILAAVKDRLPALAATARV